MKSIALLLALVLSTVTLNSSYAGSPMISTMDVMDGVSLHQEREKIISFMEGQEVQKKMISLGIDPREAIQRIGSLSSTEVNQLSREIDNAPAGGNAVGALIGAALLVFIVLLITDILGYTKVFPFTRSVN